MRFVTVSSKVFVTSFQLDVVQRTIIESLEKALVEITKPMNDSSVGSIRSSNNISKTIINKITKLRSKNLLHLSLNCMHLEEEKEVELECY